MTETLSQDDSLPLSSPDPCQPFFKMLTKPDRGATIVRLIAGYCYPLTPLYALLPMTDKLQEISNMNTAEVKVGRNLWMITEDPT